MSFKAMLDTNIVSALMRDRSGRLWERARSFSVADLCTSIVVASELRFGAYRVQSTRVHDEIRDILAVLAVLPFEAPADDVYGRLRAQLASAGRPIGPNDLFIAAHALALDLTLITASMREFSRVPGLRVDNWLD